MKNRLRKIFGIRYIVCYLCSICLYLVLPKNIITEVGVLTLVLLYTLLLVSLKIIKPLLSLYRAIIPIDFSATAVDFTFLDNLNYNKPDEIGMIVRKFKDLSEVLVEHVDSINTETYKSEHDGLSGLYNRMRYETIKSSYEICSSICIIYMDINNLKKMNDIYGHEAGDVLIKKASSKLSFWSKYGDCYRMGGDEFMVILVDKPYKECCDLVKTWYSGLGYLNRKSDGFICMFAYGLAYSEKPIDMDTLIKVADSKMYAHKVSIKKANGEDPISR